MLKLTVVVCFVLNFVLINAIENADMNPMNNQRIGRSSCICTTRIPKCRCNGMRAMEIVASSQIQAPQQYQPTQQRASIQSQQQHSVPIQQSQALVTSPQHNSPQSYQPTEQNSLIPSQQQKLIPVEEYESSVNSQQYTSLGQYQPIQQYPSQQYHQAPQQYEPTQYTSSQSNPIPQQYIVPNQNAQLQQPTNALPQYVSSSQYGTASQSQTMPQIQSGQQAPLPVQQYQSVVQYPTNQSTVNDTVVNNAQPQVVQQNNQSISFQPSVGCVPLVGGAKRCPCNGGYVLCFRYYLPTKCCRAH